MPRNRRHRKTPKDAAQQRYGAWLLAAIASLLVARPLVASESVAWRGDGAIFVALWLLIGIAWAASLFRQEAPRLRCHALDLVVVALIGWHSLSAILALRREAPRPALNMLWEWLAMGMLYFLVRQLVVRRHEIRALVAVMIGTASIAAVIGLHQYFVTMPQTRQMYESDPDAALRAIGQWSEPGSRERQLFERRLESVEPLSTFALTNSLAGFLLPWLVVGVAVAAWEKSPQAVVVWLLLVVIATCLVLTKSRAAYVSLAAAAIAGWLFSGNTFNRSWRWVVGGAAVMAIIVAIGAITGGLDLLVLTETPKSLFYRWQYWYGALMVIGAHPVFGCGPGNFGDHYTEFKLPTASEEITDPHNFVLEMGATAGVPAAVLMTAVCLALLWRFRRDGLRDDVTTDDSGDTRGANHTTNIVFIGAGLGLLVAWTVGIRVGLPISLPYLLVAGLILGGSWILLGNWIREGAIKMSVLGIASSALLLNLCAAGGIGFPGVASTLWLLVALTVNSERADAWEVPLPTFSRKAVVLGGFAAMFVAAWVTMVRPNLAREAAIERAVAEPQRAASLYANACSADVWASSPWRLLAAREFQLWQLDRAEFASVDRFHGELISRRPRSSVIWQEIGERRFSAYERSGEDTFLQSSIEALQRAAELYPNNAERHAALSKAYMAIGDVDSAKRAARKALELDAATPHAEFRLTPDLRSAVQSIAAETDP